MKSCEQKDGHLQRNLKKMSLHKNCSSWVPHELNKEQKESRVDWCKFII